MPTLITPFDEAGGIDWSSLDQLIEWHIASGAKGIFSPCLSSEMFELSAAERVKLAKYVHKQVRGRCAVMSTGTYGGTVEAMAKDVNEMGACCDAVVLVTAFLAAEEEDESVWLANAQKLLDLTPGVALGTCAWRDIPRRSPTSTLVLYSLDCPPLAPLTDECPVPYKRLLSPNVMRWIAGSGRFHFHKDTCCEMDQIKQKLAAVASAPNGTSFSFFNANVETLLPSLIAGAAGFSGISANFYPQLHAWLCAAAKQPSPPSGDTSPLQQVQDFLSLAEATVCVAYPHSAKVYVASGYPGMTLGTTCRKAGLVGVRLAPHQLCALSAMHRMQRALSQRLGITEYDPATGCSVPPADAAVTNGHAKRQKP